MEGLANLVSLVVKVNLVDPAGPVFLEPKERKENRDLMVCQD